MSVLRRLQNILQRKGKGRYGHMQEVQGVPFYEARQPWWAKFTWGFIAADLLMTCVPPPLILRSLIKARHKFNNDGANVDKVDPATRKVG